MLQITRRQLAALGSVQHARFVDGLVRRLRERYPVQLEKTDDDRLRAFIDAGIRQARVYGLVSRPQLQFYIDLAAMHGPNFDASPKTAWAGRILNDESLDADTKLARLDEAQTLLDKAKA